MNACIQTIVNFRLAIAVATAVCLTGCGISTESALVMLHKSNWDCGEYKLSFGADNSVVYRARAQGSSDIRYEYDVETGEKTDTVRLTTVLAFKEKSLPMRLFGGAVPQTKLFVGTVDGQLMLRQFVGNGTNICTPLSSL